MEGSSHFMTKKKESGDDGSVSIIDAGHTNGKQWAEIDSRFRLVAVAALRSKQLLRGSRPRIEADTRRRRNTSIALEEVRRGLVNFTNTLEDRKVDGDGDAES